MMLLEEFIGSGSFSDLYARFLPAASDDLTYIFADDCRVHVKCADQFSTLLHTIAHQIFAHLAAAVLYKCNLSFHMIILRYLSCYFYFSLYTYYKVKM